MGLTKGEVAEIESGGLANGKVVVGGLANGEAVVGGLVSGVSKAGGLADAVVAEVEGREIYP